MKLSRQEVTQRFGTVWTGSGAAGWSGEGYWFQHFIPGSSFAGATLVAKTLTLRERPGNMELTDTYAPRFPFPDCIWVDFKRGIALNSVGLSGPGLARFLETKRLQQVLRPLFISLMPVDGEPETHEEQLQWCAEVLCRARDGFISRNTGIQLNVSCPNVGADLAEVTKKATSYLDILAITEMPIIVKLNLLVSPEAAATIAEHPACSGLCMGNSLPFGELPDRIDWKGLFPNGSPLDRHDYGKGGLSGALLLPLVAEWVESFRKSDTSTHVNVGGGILHKKDVRRLANTGADSISIASVGMLRPWRVEGIIREAKGTFHSGY